MIAHRFVVPVHEVEIQAVRAQGAGGQNVNKVSNAVHLRFDIRASSLPDAVKHRLLHGGDRRITREGVVVIKAQQHRSLEMNREEAVARLVGAELAARWGQPFVVENKPAANGIVGHEAVARSAPDGYTLMVTSSGFVVAPSVYKKLPYDTERDFTPVTNIARNLGIVVVVNPSVPASTLQEFIAYAKDPGNKVSYSSPGIGNTLHLIGELFNA